jgi:hypothetical protein
MLFKLPIEVIQTHVLPNLDSISQLAFCNSTKHFCEALSPDIPSIKKTGVVKFLTEFLHQSHQMQEVNIKFGYSTVFEITWCFKRLYILKKENKKIKQLSYATLQGGLTSLRRLLVDEYFEKPITVTLGRTTSLYDQSRLKRRFQTVFKMELN